MEASGRRAPAPAPERPAAWQPHGTRPGVLAGSRTGPGVQARSSPQHPPTGGSLRARRPRHSAQVPRAPTPPLVTMRTGYKQEQPPSIKHGLPKITANTESQTKEPINVTRGHHGATEGQEGPDQDRETGNTA